MTDPLDAGIVAAPSTHAFGTNSSATGLFVAPKFRPRPIRELQPSEISKGLGNEEFWTAYQPFISMATGVITGFEALLRWHHPYLGPVSPADFIPVAEEAGMIDEIGIWVLQTACRQAKAWPEACRIAVNVSPSQLQNPSFAHRVAACLNTSGLPARRLELELTEGLIINDNCVTQSNTDDLRALGVSIALDDFGSGYSTLSYLQRFACDRIKIDRSFISNMSKRRESKFLIQSMHDLARQLGMAVTAEGVETEEEARMLREIGTMELQGFLFSRPVASDVATGLLSGALKHSDL